MAPGGTRPLVLLAAGGTGGHLFPAEALAVALQARGVTVDLATDERATRYGTAFPARTTHLIPSATFRGRDPLSLAKTVTTLGFGTMRAWTLLGRLRPAAVVGFGGYPTIPPVFAATLRGIPTILHEQNGVMGRANRFLARRVTAIATSFPGLATGDATLAAKMQHTGNPVRPAVIAAAATPYPPLHADAPIRLLVFGGSQGARVMADIVPPAMEHLDAATRARLSVTQQARDEDAARVRETYTRFGVAADVAPFFTDLPARMAAAHLVVSRSGASTVAELAAIGRPAIMVPLPHALDQDQLANANVLANAGGGIVIKQADFTPPRLAREIAALAGDPQRLAAMAAAAHGIGIRDAAERLAEFVLRVAGISKSAGMSLKTPLNSFQLETERHLHDMVLAHQGLTVSREVVGSDSESFIRASIQPTGLSVCIYVDGADMSGQGIDSRFEIYDYETLSDLQKALLSAVKRHIA